MISQKSFLFLTVPVLLVVLMSVAVTGSVSDGQTASSIPIWTDRIGQYSTLVDCSGNGGYVIAGTDTGIVRMYNHGGKILWTYENPEKSVMSVSISGNGDYCAAAFFDPHATSHDSGGEIVFFDKNGEVLWNFHTGATIHRLDLSSDGDTLFASGNWEFYSFDNTGTLLGKNMTRSGIWAVAAAADGDSGIAGTGMRDNLIIAMGRNGTVLWEYKAQSTVGAVGISDEGDAAVASDYNHLYRFDRDGNRVWQYNSSPPFTDVAITSDGNTCAASSQYFLRVFNKTGAMLWQYEDHGYVNSVAISDNGDYIIGGTSYATLLFDKSGKNIWKYPNGTSQVCASDDGMVFAASSSRDVYFFNRWGTAKVIDLPPANQSTNPIITPGNISSPATTQSRSASLSIFCIIAAALCASAIVIVSINR